VTTNEREIKDLSILKSNRGVKGQQNLSLHLQLGLLITDGENAVFQSVFLF